MPSHISSIHSLSRGDTSNRISVPSTIGRSRPRRERPHTIATRPRNIGGQTESFGSQQIGASRGTLAPLDRDAPNNSGDRISLMGVSDAFLNQQNELFLSQPVEFEQVVPNFISKHVRDFCDQKCKMAAAGASGGAMGLGFGGPPGTLQNSYPNDGPIAKISLSVVPGVGIQQIMGGTAALAGIVSGNVRGGTVERVGIPDIEPCAQEYYAAVVMADVSGYSKLTSTLAEKGPIGAELLCKTMKGYIDKIIQIILMHGGDIVKFVGDAVIFYWKAGDGDTGSADAVDEIVRGELVLKACKCCMDLLSDVGTYEIDIPDCSTTKLRIHLGIGAGKVYDVHVGGAGRWEHFVSGDAVNQLARVLDMAGAGQLAMSHPALRSVSTIIEIDTITMSNYDKHCVIVDNMESARRKVPPPTPPDNEEMMLWDVIPPTANVELYKNFINQSALFKLQADINQSRLFRLRSGLGELLSLYELRQVSTVFIRVGSLGNWETPAKLGDAQQAMMVVQSALKKYEGSLRQFHVDEKGAVILCFFGLPPLAHENDASFAIKAALEVCAQFSNIFDDFSIGITTGVVSIGGVGNAVRTEYAVMGDSINMAARLMCLSQARESLLCDERSFNLCAMEFLFEGLGEEKVKGKDRPISIFRPKSIRSDAGKQHRGNGGGGRNMLIGRTKEKLVIDRALASHTTDDSAGVVIMEADGGQGLSTLFFEPFVARRNSMGGATEMEKATPFFTFRDIIHDLFSILESATVDEKGVVRFPEQIVPEEETESPATPAEVVPAAPASGPPPTQGSRNILGFVTRSRKSIISEDESRKSISVSMPNGSTCDKNLPPKPDSQPQPQPSPDKLMLRNNSVLKTLQEEAKIGDGSPPAQSNIPTISVGGEWGSASETGAGCNSDLPFEVKARAALAKFGLDENLASLFDLVLPHEFKTSESLALETVPAKLRIKELTDLIRQLIATIGGSTPLVLVFHEAQWIDTVSWELLWEIVTSSSKTMVFIFTRPDRYHETEENRMFFHKFKRLPRAQCMTLEGFSLEETRQMILATWTGTPLKSVSDTIAQNIYRRTSGNPLFIRSLVGALKDTGQWRVTDYGELTTQTPEFDFDRIVLGNDLQSVIVAQFDRLDRTYQLFLKIASVLGLRFLMEDVMIFLSELPGFNERFDRRNHNQFGKKIESLDKYGFLQRVEGDSEGFVIQFKSAVVRKCVYNMMVQSQRQQLHLNVAMYYEKIMNDSNRHRLLIPLYEHYLETDDRHRIKKLRYLEQVANFYYDKRSMADAIKHYQLLLEMAAAVQQETDKVLYDSITLATWHRRLGEALYQRGEPREAETHLRESLLWVGHEFPASDMKLRWRAFQELRTYQKNSIPALPDKTSLSNLGAVSVGGLMNSGSCGSGGLPMSRESNRDGLNVIGMGLGSSIRAQSRRHANSDGSGGAQTSTLGVMDQQQTEEADELALLLRDPRMQILHNVRLCYLTLAEIYETTDDAIAHKYVTVRGLNISELFPKDALFGRLQGIAGAAVWAREGQRELSLRLLEAAGRADRRSDLSNSAGITSCIAHTLFLMGAWEGSMRNFDRLIDLAGLSNDTRSREDGLRMKSIILYFTAARSHSLQIARELYALANQEDHWEGKFWGCFLIIANLLSMANSDAELRDMIQILQNLWQSLPSRLETNPEFYVARLGLLLECDIRVGLGLDIHEYLQELERLFPLVSRIDVMSAMGVMLATKALFAAHNSGYFSSKRTGKAAKRFCETACQKLKQMGTMCVAEAVRFLCSGARHMINGRSRKAVKKWRKGLVAQPTQGMPLVLATLRARLARYDKEPQRQEHMDEAQKLFRRLGATFEFERIAQK
ncbi:hypothetical protein HK104_006720 [Borealophlyctis nickersoniae]|nr:hypothetical protein HK104_006720 [Borealophlyctis nickersoniae]